MKKLWTIALLIAGMTACQSSGNKNTQSGEPTETAAEFTDAQTYVSDDGQYRFLVSFKNPENIRVKDLGNGETYDLTITRAASGAKYSDSEGNVFWTKGDGFMWMKNDDLITSGSLLESTFTGNYITNDYLKRNEGYDWVAVKVKRTGKDQLLFQVRSRADKKKPTCTWDEKAFRESDKRYYAYVDNNKILFTFSGDTLSIEAESEAGNNALHFFCSGGASLAGKYFKTDEALDPEQVDPTVFSKVLKLQGIGFNITATRNNGMSEVTISPFGLEIDNRPVTHQVEGSITDAEIEDLNADGSPEILVYSRSDGSGSYGNVLAYSVNNRKSMSDVYFPPVSGNPDLSKGYMGHDEFRVVENYLVQRFPIYNEGDSNAQPTGGIRQITYKLVNGEASRIFEVRDIVHFEGN